MVPQRFIYEYPARCLQLIEKMEHIAREESLIGSFSLMIAPALFVIPYERMNKTHPLREGEREPDIYRAIKREQRRRFLQAAFWRDRRPGDWRFSRIMAHPDNSRRWVDENGLHPMSPASENKINDQTVGKVLRVLRNALAHGNVVYLDEAGFESRGAELQYLAFLSRYEELPEQRAESETYRLLVTTEEEFLGFLRAWASWLQEFGPDDRILEAA